MALILRGNRLRVLGDALKDTLKKTANTKTQPNTASTPVLTGEQSQQNPYLYPENA